MSHNCLSLLPTTNPKVDKNAILRHLFSYSINFEL